MSKAKITLIGFYNYFINNNDDLFLNLSLPAQMDKDTFVDSLLLRGGEFEVLYSNPDFMKEAIGVWSRKNSRTLTKWAEALEIKYDPLNNYDRTEEWTDNLTNSSNDVSNGNTNTESSSSDSSTNKVSAFDTDGFQNKEQDEGTAQGQTSLNAKSDNTHNGTEQTVHKGSIKGNIGVTTSQQMLLSELDESAPWNIYDHAIDLFLREFVIPVY